MSQARIGYFKSLRTWLKCSGGATSPLFVGNLDVEYFKRHPDSSIMTKQQVFLDAYVVSVRCILFACECPKWLLFGSWLLNHYMRACSLVPIEAQRAVERQLCQSLTLLHQRRMAT
eukprot:1044917-Amphidinium_carterae.1